MRRIVSSQWMMASFGSPGYYFVTLSCGHHRTLRQRLGGSTLIGKPFKTAKCYECGAFIAAGRKP